MDIGKLFKSSYLLIVLGVLASCGGDSNDDGSNENQAARLSITPESTLLTGLNDTHQLHVQTFNAAGDLLNKEVIWSSSNTESVTVDALGLLTSTGKVGSATITAEVDGITSSPVNVLVTLPALNTQLVTDDQVVGNFALVDPDAPFEPGTQYRVTLKGMDAPDIGTILLAREDMPLAGRVVDVQSSNGELVVTLEILPINELFTDLKIDQIFVPSEDDISISSEAADYYSMQQQDDGSYLFTLLPDAPAIASAPGLDSISSRAAIGTSANPYYPFDCELTGPSFTGPNNMALTIQGLSPTIALEQDISLPIIYDSSNGGLQKLTLMGRVKGTLTVRNKISVQLEGKASCKLKLLEVNIPLPGALALVLGGQIPIGLGFELGGKVTLADMGFGVTTTAEMQTEFGLTCPNGNNCTFDGSFTPSGEIKPLFDFPPTFNNLTADLKFEPALAGYGYADFTFGNPIFSSLRLTLANLQAGVKQGANLAFVETQIVDALYASDYKLTTEFSAKPGIDLARVLDLLGAPRIAALTLTASTIITTSPAAESPAPPAKLITADVGNYSLNDTVNFRVKLDPTTINYLPLIYNIDEILIYKKTDTNGTLGAELIATTGASEGQTEFDLSWIATENGEVGDNFYAFVSTSLLPLPYLGELELGKVNPSSINKIAFVGRFEGDSSDDIYVMNVDGSNRINLTQDDYYDANPAWSPDGLKIAFTSYREDSNGYDIYVMDADGSNRVNITQHALTDGWPVWSPDGLKIAFISDRDGDADIFVMNADGSNPVNLTPTYSQIVGETTPAWSPDGSKIAYRYYTDNNTRSDIYVMDANGSNRANLTNSETNYINLDPAWSPDGLKIAFSSNRNGGHYNIWVMDADGSNPVNLTQNNNLTLDPVWSSDGSHIAFGIAGEIYVMNADGADQVSLTVDFGRSLSQHPSPAWSP